MYSRAIFFIAFLLISPVMIAQFQMGNDPLRVSTSLAGTKSAPRIAANYLNDVNGTFEEYRRTITYSYMSYDNFIKPIKSGIGVYFRNGMMKNSGFDDFYNLRNTTVGICIAPKFSNSAHFPSVTLSPSFGIEWISYMLKFGATGFDDTKIKKNILAARFGLMINTSYCFLGTGIKYLSTNERNYIFTSFFAGYTFKKSINSKFAFSPTINILYVDAFGAIDPEARSENYLYLDALNLNFRYQKFIFGTGIPNAMLGFQNDKLRTSISFNFGLIKANNFFDGQTSTNSILFSLVYSGKPKEK